MVKVRFHYWMNDGLTYVDSRLNARLHASALERDVHTPLSLDSSTDVRRHLLRCGKFIFNSLWAFCRQDGCIAQCSKAFFNSKVNTPLIDVCDDDTRSSRKLRHRSNKKANCSSTDNEHGGAGGEGAIAERAAGCVNSDGKRLDEGGVSVGDAWGKPTASKVRINWDP